MEDNRKELGKSTLVKLAFGISPIPVVGEIALAAGFYDILRDTPVKHASVPAALLTRIPMYTNWIVPLYESLGLISQ